METRLREPVAGVGASLLRVDGVPKVTGAFIYASDLSADGMLWGATLRSPHPHARIRAVDADAGRWESPGVHACSSPRTPGNELRAQFRRPAGAGARPLSAMRASRSRWSPPRPRNWHAGDPRIVVEWSRSRFSPTWRQRCGRTRRGCTTSATCCATSFDPRRPGQTPPPMSGSRATSRPACRTRPRSARRRGSPSAERRRRRLHVATQWLHVDREQIAPCLGLPREKVRLHPGRRRRRLRIS